MTTATATDFTLLKGDAIAQLRTLDAESVHAVVCDPPYGLTTNQDPTEMLHAWLTGETYVCDEDGYDGASWDNAVPGPELWREVERVLVPGGFVLAFAATRTVGYTQLAIQLAGLHLRDLITWVYAPGRPATRDLGRVAVEETGDTSLAAQLAGQRATLRPGYEPIVVARKPFDEGTRTIENVLDFGVGTINHRAITGGDGLASNVWFVHDIFCVDGDCSCDLADSDHRSHATHLFPRTSLGEGLLTVKKPNKAERPVGPDGLTHETVKPLIPMRRLIEAVTHEGQIVLDPFLGSGSTAEAALQCGRHVIGCELVPSYWPLIEARIARFENTEQTSSSVRRRSSGGQATSVRPHARSGRSNERTANPGEPRQRHICKKEKIQ
jgi:DNA modification methylase